MGKWRMLSYGILIGILCGIVFQPVDGQNGGTGGVNAGPLFYQQPVLKGATTRSTTAVILPGSSQTLICKASGTPRPNYRWLKNGISLNETPLEDGEWTINAVAEVDAGEYRCIAESPLGSVLSQALELRIVPPAHITPFQPFHDPIRRVKEGEALILRPPWIESVPNASYTWYAGNRPISDKANSRKYVLTLENALVILDATTEENGQYHVEAFNLQLGQRRISEPVNVVVAVDATSPLVKFPPGFVVPPVNFTVKPGDQEATFECIVNSRPLPELRLSWRAGKDGSRVLQSDGINYRLTADGHRLTVLNPNHSHEDSYECLAELPGVGTASHRAYLTISSPPVIIQRPDLDIQVLRGQTVLIPCGSHGQPPVTRRWFKNAQLLAFPAVPAETDKLKMMLNGSLIISTFVQDDAGIFQCFVRNSAGEDSANTWLHSKPLLEVSAALMFPSSPLNPSMMSVLENQPAVLPCSIANAGPTNTKWLFNGTPIGATNTHYSADGSSGDLLISFASRSMSGIYNCIVQSTDGASLNHTITLTVTDRTRISGAPKDARLVIGSKVSFLCGVTKEPSVKAEIQWYQDGKLLDTGAYSPRRQILPDGTLEITNARSSDIGFYTCRVFSIAGNDSQSARLDIIELPYAPRIRAELINGTKHVNVSWMPDFDGNSPIVRFILQYKQMSDTTDPASQLDIGWQTLLSNFSATDRFYVVKDLKPSAAYQFRVSAVNNVGEGLPSTPTQPILLPQTPPTSAPKFAASARNATAIMVQWQPPAESEWNGILRGYDIRYKLAGYNDLAWTEIPVNQEARRNFILEDLIAWKLYEIQMAAFNDKGVGVWSDSARVKTLEGVPEAAPTDLLGKALSSTTLSVSWRQIEPQQINGVNQGYRVEIWDHLSTLENLPLRSVEVAPSAYDPLEHQTAIFDNLKKFETYNITIFGFTSAGNGPRSSPVLVTTLEDLPGPVQTLHITNIRDRTLDISWEVPESPNGIITGYVVECSQLDTLTNSTAAPRVFRLLPDQKIYRVTELTPQTNYLIKVYASTRVGDGEARIARIQSSVPPTLPCPPDNVQITDIQARNATITFGPVCDGNTSILQINCDIQTREMKPDVWKKFHVQKDNFTDGQFTLGNLSPFTEYRVRLSVENVVGPSLPSAASDWFQSLSDRPSNSPGNFSLRAINATAIRARWTPLVTSQWNGKPGNYWISFRSLNASLTAPESGQLSLLVNDSTSGSTVLAGLEEFTTYEAVIEARNDIGSSGNSSAVVDTTRESVPGSPPEGVLAHGIGSTAIVVQWNNISAIHQNGILLGFKVYYTTGADTKILDIPDPSVHSATLTNLEKYKEYAVQVAGYTRMGAGIRSPPVTERTLEDVPDRPYNVLFPEVSTTQVKLTWEPPIRPNGIILGYRVSFKLEGGYTDVDSAFLPPNARSFLASSLRPEKIYWFTLVANTSVGWGSALEVPVRTVQFRERPERPSKPAVSVSMIQSRSLSVSWQSGHPDENAPLRYFQLQYSKVPESSWKSVQEKLDARTTSYTIQDLKPDSLYKFRVQAINDVGNSEWSDESDAAETSEDVPDAPPQDFSAVPYTTSSLTLSWQPPPAKTVNGHLIGYTIQYHRLLPGIIPTSAFSFDEVTVSANTTTHNLTDLVRRATYEVRITAFTVVGAGPFSPLLTVYVGEAVPSSKPSDVAVEGVSSSSVTISWTPTTVPLDGSGIPTGYKVIFTDIASGIEEGVDLVEPTITQHTIRNLHSFSKYQFVVLAFNAAGDGPKAQAVEAITSEGIPKPPENVRVEDIQLNQVRVLWNAPIRPNGVLRGYEVIYSTVKDVKEPQTVAAPLAVSSVPHALSTSMLGGKAEKTRHKRVGPNETSIVLTGLEETVVYSIGVRVETGQGFGNISSINVTTGPQPGSPGKPTHLLVDLAETAVSLRWKKGEQGASPVTGYLVQGRRDDASSWDTVDTLSGGPAEHHDLSYLNLVPSTRYAFRVVSMNRLGVSMPSDASPEIQTPNWNSVVGLAPKKPFYMELWFLILVAATGSVLIILLIACLCIKSKAAKYRQEVEKVISSADILAFPEDDEFAAPTAFELRQSMRRSTRKPSHSSSNIYASSAAAASLRRKHVLSNTTRAPPFTISAPPAGIVPSIAYSDIADVSELYPPHVNRAFINNEDSRAQSIAGTSRASSSLTEKRSEMLNESSTDEVDDDSGETANRSEGDILDEQSSSFVNHYANVKNNLGRPWADTVGTNDSRHTARLPDKPRVPYRRSTATSISASIADSDSTSISFSGINQQLLVNNTPGSRNPLPGFSSFV